MNNEKFNLKVSIAQLIIGLLITPAIVYIFVVNTPDINQHGFWDYIITGFYCVISLKNLTPDDP